MINIKKILIISFFLLVLILIGVLFFSWKFYDSGQDFSESDKLIEDNADIINRPYYEADSDLRLIDDSDVVWGDRDAQVQIIVYEDLSDFYSSEFNNTLNLVKNNFSDDIVIAFRPYTSKRFSSSKSVYLFVECAKEQESFFKARDLILNKTEEGSLSMDDFPEYAKELDLDFNELDACLNNNEYMERIEDLSNEARSFGVYGSPSIFVDQEMVLGARPFEDVVNGQEEFLPGMKSIVSSHINSD